MWIVSQTQGVAMRFSVGGSCSCLHNHVGRRNLDSRETEGTSLKRKGLILPDTQESQSLLQQAVPDNFVLEKQEVQPRPRSLMQKLLAFALYRKK